jgi:hypothetical protein
MGSSFRRRFGPRALLFVVLALLTLGASQASGARPERRAACTWGASSIRAQVVHGQIVSTPAARSGCTGP